MRKADLVALVDDADRGLFSSLRAEHMKTMINAGRITSPDIVRCALGLSEEGYDSFCTQFGVPTPDGMVTAKRSDDDGKGASEPEVDEDELRKMARTINMRHTKSGYTTEPDAKAKADVAAKAKADADADKCDADMMKSFAKNGLLSDYMKGCKAHYPAPLGSSTLEQQSGALTSRELHASIAPNDGGEAEKQVRVLRLASELAGGEPKRPGAGLLTGSMDNACTTLTRSK